MPAHLVRTTEQHPGTLEITLAERTAHGTAADSLAVHIEGARAASPKTEPPAGRNQALEISGAIPAVAKIVPDHQVGHCKTLNQYLLNKVIGDRPARSLLKRRHSNCSTPVIAKRRVISPAGASAVAAPSPPQKTRPASARTR